MQLKNNQYEIYVTYHYLAEVRLCFSAEDWLMSIITPLQKKNEHNYVAWR